MIRRKNDIKYPMIYKAIFVIVLPLFLFILFYILYTLETAEKGMEKRELNKMGALSYKVAYTLTDFLKTVSDQAVYTANELLTRDSITESQAANYLKKLLEENDLTYGAGVVMKDYYFDQAIQNAYVYLYKKDSSIKTLSYTDDQQLDFTIQSWWKKTFVNGKPFWSSSYYDKLTGEYMVSYSYPIIHNKDIIGVILVDLNLSKIFKAIESVTQNEREETDPNNLLILSIDSTIIYSPSGKNFGKKYTEITYSFVGFETLVSALDSAIKHNHLGYDQFMFDDEKHYIIYAPVVEAKWLVVSDITESQIKHFVKGFMKERFILIFFVIILIPLALFFTLRRFLINPIKELSNASLKLAEGNYDISLSPKYFNSKYFNINKYDELGKLVNNFQLMKENLKKREEDFQTQTKNFVNILDNLPLIIGRFSLTGEIVYTNEFTKKTYHFLISKRENRYNNIRDYLNKKYHFAIEKSINGHLHKIEGNDLFITPENKNLFPNKYFTAYFIPVFDQNKVASVLIVVIDITKQKQNENLKIEKRSAELSEQAKSEFLARMSHEIRTPMNAIIGFSELSLKKLGKNSSIYGYFNKIKQSSDHLLKIINDILDYSKIEAGKMELEEIDFDLEELLVDIHDMALLMSDQKGLDFNIIYSPLLPTYLKGDPNKIKQILMNLIGNAIKFTDQGYVLVKIEPGEQTNEEISIRFEVEDTGIGMTSKEIKNLFVPFVQADGSATRKYGGIGIGLSITKRLIEKMGGEISVQSQKGKGTKFSFNIVLKHNCKIDKEKLFKQKLELSKSLEGLKILVCDQSNISRSILKNILSDFNFQVEVVNSGKELIEHLKKTAKEYDLLLMDKNMPEMDGIETMHHLIELGLKKYLKKVILITEYDISAEKELLEQLSIDHFVNKPINHSVLLDAIMVAFQRKKTTSKKKRKAKVKQNKVVGECLVLLVDDNEINRDLAKDLLNSIGIEVDLASDGEEALEKMKASGKPSKYCLVFMDLQMPIMDGFETTEKIRTFDTDIPIVALTADLDPQIKKKIKKSGLNDSVAKPIDPVQIIKKLKKWVKNVEISAVKKSSYQKQKEEQNKLHSLKHVYVTNALERTGGKYENLVSALKKFEKKYRKFLSVFSSIEDKEEKLSYVHTVKGVSGNIGAIYLHKLLIQLEDNLRKDKDIDELLDLIEVEINFLTEEIRAIPFKGKTKNEKAQKLSPYDFKNTLEKLKTMLKEGDADALKVLKLMEENFENKKDFQEIHNLVLNYDYDEALNKLNNLFDLA